MIYALLLIPAIAAVLSLIVRSNIFRRIILVTAAVSHTVITITAWNKEANPLLNGWLMLDKPGLLFLTITSVLFLACSLYAFGYLAGESGRKEQDFEEGIFFTNAPAAIFCACLLAFLTTMTLVTVSQHFGLMWVAMEATTLASAPLIYFHRHHRSLEATWKYLLICSVGIALALLGNFFMVIAASAPESNDKSMILSVLLQQGHLLNVPWLKAAFLLFLVGYGTKMGLAPMHTWLPDAHSESPSVVSALMSGALLNCAFLGILRSYQVCLAAGLGRFCQDLLVLFGLISIGWAAVFILGQPDYKRMLAYSSVEHMGILALGVGIGAGATFGAMLHAVNHSLTKAMLFLAAGNILAVYKTKTTKRVSGIMTIMPATGIIWIAGFFAITGIPPFGIFLSEFTIVKSMIEQGRIGIAVAFLAILALIFIGMAIAFLNMAQGRKDDSLQIADNPDTAISVLPPLALGALTLMLGLYIPPVVNNLLHDVAVIMGGY
ncbi:MAG: proton-conducting transporter membrane subunit [Phycisphaerae bacterium]|nr:proton-conducting transporter membrane subunit [Phycisphaerae bacterium]